MLSDIFFVKMKITNYKLTLYSLKLTNIIQYK